MSARAYAEGTSVPVSRTIAELRSVVEKYGGSGWIHAEHEHKAMVGWTYQGRAVRFVIALPTMDHPRVKWMEGDRNRIRPANQRPNAQKAEERRIWRSLFAVVKAKLVAVDDGVVGFEAEFLSNIVLPGTDGATIYDGIAGRLDQLLESGDVSGLLPRAITGGDS